MLKTQKALQIPQGTWPIVQHKGSGLQSDVAPFVVQWSCFWVQQTAYYEFYSQCYSIKN